jgi:hypothetical protein
VDDIVRLQIVVQFCRAQIQRNTILIKLCELQIQCEQERDEMTPKFKGLRAAMDKLRSGIDDEAGKLLDRVEGLASKEAPEAFALAHGALDVVKSDIKEITDFITDLSKSNGGGPLDDSSTAPAKPAAPRSSDLA